VLYPAARTAKRFSGRGMSARVGGELKATASAGGCTTSLQESGEKAALWDGPSFHTPILLCRMHRSPLLNAIFLCSVCCIGSYGLLLYPGQIRRRQSRRPPIAACRACSKSAKPSPTATARPAPSAYHSLFGNKPQRTCRSEVRCLQVSWTRPKAN
jgi:hypothetical protein